MEFGTVLTAMVTPMDDNLEVNYKEARKLANHLLQNGTDAIVLAGTTGESPTLTFQEKITLFAEVKTECGKKTPIIANTGSYSTKESIELTKEAEKAGVDGIMLVVPYYNKPSQDALFNHFRKVAESTSLPVILYNIPSRTGRNLEAETLARLAQVDNIVGIKEASGDIEQVSKISLLAGKNIEIYSGEDSHTLAFLSLGAKGVISVASHLVGIEMKEMINSFQRGDTKKALEIHLKLFPLFKALFIQTNPVPVKAALNLCGFECGGVRPPLLPATEDELKKIRAEMKKLNVI